jgi:hypothetical protein
MAKAPELYEVLEPLYRNALWSLVVISRLRAGLPAQPWTQPTFPLAEQSEVGLANLVADDEGHALTEGNNDFLIARPLCGGRQRDGYTCIRVLSDDGWCPRHGRRKVTS